MTNKFKGGPIHRGWELSKSSWRVLMLDKELVGLPALSIVVSLVAIMGFGAAAFFYLVYHSTGSWNPMGQDIVFQTNNIPLWINLGFFFLFYLAMTLISNLFGAAVIVGATERFEGGDPSFQGSLRGAVKKFRPLALFSLMMATVGMALQLLQERVPLAGQIAVWLFNAAWSVANIFAIPVIVLSKHDVSPLDATRQSVGVIRKVWGESVVADLGISIIAVASVVGYFMLWTIIGVGLFTFTHATAAVIAFFTVAGLGLLSLTLVFTALTSIAKAALYHYATTGKAPELFNRELLKAGMTRKKARKVFA